MSNDGSNRDELYTLSIILGTIRSGKTKLLLEALWTYMNTGRHIVLISADLSERGIFGRLIHEHPTVPRETIQKMLMRVTIYIPDRLAHPREQICSAMEQSCSEGVAPSNKNGSVLLYDQVTREIRSLRSIARGFASSFRTMIFTMSKEQDDKLEELND